MKKTYQILPQSVLKIIAIFSMTIDHFGAVVVEPWYLNAAYAGMPSSHRLFQFYIVLRSIGRIAFPVYCFLLTEGFYHTRSRWRYARNLLIFALVSEIPFDLGIAHVWIEFDHQNVFFTLFFGLLAMMGMQKCREKIENIALRIALMATIAAAMIAVALLLRTDYDGWGVSVIILMYLVHPYHFVAGAGGCTVLTIMQTIEGWSFLGLPLYLLYNGERGRQKKYFFYIYYPAHFLILYLVYLFWIEPMIL